MNSTSNLNFIEETDYSFKIRLIQQSPIIHFQSKQKGACLRVSEVKPKLDKFLSRRMKTQQNSWKMKQHDAFDYKMSIRSITEPERIVTPSIYYGNMGVKPNEQIECLRADNELSVICFIPELLSEIKSHIEEFFIVTNFGRMSDKGFGSYIVDGSRMSDKQIGQILADDVKSKECYVIAGYGSKDVWPVQQPRIDKATGQPKLNKKGQQIKDTICPVFDDIKTMYSVMKSGININGDYQRSYLFLYCHEKMSMGNEKYVMKRDKVSPVIGTHDYTKGNQNEKDYRYVRAVLGVGDHIDYKISTERNNKETLKISISSDDIERCCSPIRFKIIGGKVFLYADRVNDKILGKDFAFKGKKAISITTPDSFDIDAFLKYFVKSYSSDMQKWRTEKRNRKCRISKNITVAYSTWKEA